MHHLFSRQVCLQNSDKKMLVKSVKLLLPSSHFFGDYCHLFLFLKFYAASKSLIGDVVL